MGESGDSDKRRNRVIARNEEKRKAIGAMRISTWAIAVALIFAALVIAIIWRG